MGVYSEFVHNEYHKLNLVAKDIVEHCASEGVLDYLDKNPSYIIENLHTDNAFGKAVVVKSAKIPQLKIAITTEKEHPLPGDFKKVYQLSNVHKEDSKDFAEFLDNLNDITLLKTNNISELSMDDIEKQSEDLLHFQPFDIAITKEQMVTELLDISKALDDKYDIHWTGEGTSYDDYPKDQKDNPYVASLYVQDGIKMAYHEHSRDEVNNDIVLNLACSISDKLSTQIFGTDIIKTLDSLYRDYEIRSDWKTALQGVRQGTALSGAISYGFSKEDISTLAEIHRDNRGLRKKIEDLLEDCNFHYECGEFASKHYDKFIIKKEDNEKTVTEELEEDEVER